MMGEALTCQVVHVIHLLRQRILRSFHLNIVVLRVARNEGTGQFKWHARDLSYQCFLLVFTSNFLTSKYVLTNQAA